MDNKKNPTPKRVVLEWVETEHKGQVFSEWRISGKTESEESKIRCYAAKQIVEQHFCGMTRAEAYEKLGGIKVALKTMKESGLITIDQALESTSLAGAIAAYLCTDGLSAQERESGLRQD